MKKSKIIKKTAVVLMSTAMAAESIPATVMAGETKWSEEVTADGWVKVTNEGGKTLGYSPESGVTIIENDGYAFKDLNKNGQLDTYEDWRQDDETRAAALAEVLSPEEIIPLLWHNGLKGVGEEELPEEAKANLDAGQRSLQNSDLVYDAVEGAKFNNKVQAYVEAKGYGIPGSFSSDPGFGVPNENKILLGFPVANLALAATFDTELVAEASEEVAKLYRAAGVTTLLGPQFDLSSEPRWPRIQSTFGEDPALSRDMAKVQTGAYQSTYDEEGNDLGWGDDSIIVMAKHFPGDGAGESGRESHNAYGKYAVYPGNNFEAHLIPFFDGAFNLDSTTEEAAAVMTSFSAAYTEDGPLGDEGERSKGTAWSEYKIGLLRDNGWDGLIVTDWQVIRDTGKPWGVEDLTKEERAALAIEAGVDQLGGDFDMDVIPVLYDMLVEDMGEEAALTRIRESARRLFVTFNRVGLFDNPYIDTAKTAALYADESLKEFAKEVSQKGIVMVKNTNDAIKPAAETEEKPTVYIPMTFAYSTYRHSGTEWRLPVNLEEASKYYNVITDTIGEPSGKDDDGNAIYTEADIIRA